MEEMLLTFFASMGLLTNTMLGDPAKDMEPMTTQHLKKVFTKMSQEGTPFVGKFLKEGPVKKSALVQEIAHLIEPQLGKDPVWPPDFELTQFKDIKSSDPQFEAARELRSLGLLRTPGGRFGKKNEPDPVLKNKEVKQILERAFDLTQKGFIMNNDFDQDGFGNEQDLCPNIPGTDEGCPEILTEKKEYKSGIQLVLPEDSDLLLVENDVIRIGDIMTAAILDQKTGEIFSESNGLKVER